MIDTHFCLRCHSWFCMKRDSCACELDHAKIVGPVTHGNCILRGEAKTVSDFDQLFHFCFAAEDRIGNGAA
ncbi:hypothetical protein D3C80_1766720 [compost metagenome]